MTPTTRWPAPTPISSRPTCDPSCSRSREHLRGRSAVASVHSRDPPKGGVPGERGAVLPEPRGQRAGPWVGELRRLDERIQKRGGGQVGDAEAVPDKVAARLELALDAVERRDGLLTRDLGARGVDLVAEPVERTEDG